MRRLAALSTFVLAVSCNASPGDLREWRPSDHDHTSEPNAGQVEVQPDGGSAPELAAHGLNEVTLVAWQQNCILCHGTIGRGDGPQGPSLRATDLTKGEWQRSVTDEQIAAAIKNGKGTMPPFSLPDSTIKGLVHLIRLLDISRLKGPAGSATPSASGSAPPASVSSTTKASPRPGQPGPAPAASARPLPAGHPPIAAPAASQ